jgi:hypothetical protein
MTRRRRDQVSEAFERDSIAVVNELLHRVVQRKDFSHGAGSRFLLTDSGRKRRDALRRND